MKQTVDRAYLTRIADRICAYMTQDHSGDWGMDIHDWDWVPGVGVIGLLSYYEATRKPELMDTLLRWTQTNLHKAERLKVINSMAPFAIFPALYRETQDPQLLATARRIADWMIAEAPRTREGAFEHTVTEGATFPEQVWADTIFMAVLFLARMAKLTGESVYANEAVSQLDIHLRLLQDEATGVLFHGWNCGEGSHMSAARWTRANAWVAIGTPMILEELAGVAEVPQAAIDRYKTMMLGLIRFQRPDGLWPTVMDQPGFYPETSGSAGIAAGLFRSVRMGLLEEEAGLPAAELALQAVLKRVKESGEVTGVSGGTPVMPSIEAYNGIPQYPTLYGQALALLMLVERMALLMKI